MFDHRLLLIAETFPPSLGGVQAYVSGLWSALPAAKSFVVARAQPGDAAWDAAQSYRIVRVHTRALTYPRWRPAWQAARDVVRREKIEAVVCGKALFEGRAARRLQAEFHIPYVVCTHASEILTWLRRPRTRRQLQKVLASAGRVVVINDHIKERLRAFGVPEERLVKFYAGVPKEYFHAPTETEGFRARHGLQGKRVVASVARLVPRKGHRILLEALRLVLGREPAAHLVVAGSGPERVLLEKQAHVLGLSSHVTFLGEVSPEDNRCLLAAAEVFALTPLNLPDDMEGFGIVYIEAAAMRVPVVASRVGGVPEAVLDQETGILVPAGDAPATAQALLGLLADPTERARLGANARARADREFHWRGRALVFQGMVDALLGEQ